MPVRVVEGHYSGPSPHRWEGRDLMLESNSLSSRAKNIERGDIPCDSIGMLSPSGCVLARMFVSTAYTRHDSAN